MSLDAATRRYLDERAAVARPLPWDDQIDEMRREALDLAIAEGHATEVGAVHELSAPGPAGDMRVRVYEPPAQAAGAEVPRGTITWLHGGGFVFGSLESYDETCRRLSAETNAVVFSVDYRLAPEHRFPAAVLDVVEGTRFAARTAPDFGADPLRHVVAGDSAGGNLAAVTALRLRDLGGTPLRGQFLIYPTTDMRPGDAYPSRLDAGEGYGLSSAAMEWFGRAYLSDEALQHHPDASPMVVADLSDLPPAFVLTAEFDPLRDEGDAYAARLREAGVEVEHHAIAGAIHGVFTNAGVLPTGEVAWQRALPWLRKRLA